MKKSTRSLTSSTHYSTGSNWKATTTTEGRRTNSRATAFNRLARFARQAVHLQSCPRLTLAGSASTPPSASLGPNQDDKTLGAASIRDDGKTCTAWVGANGIQIPSKIPAKPGERTGLQLGSISPLRCPGLAPPVSASRPLSASLRPFPATNRSALAGSLISSHFLATDGTMS